MATPKTQERDSRTAGVVTPRRVFPGIDQSGRLLSIPVTRLLLQNDKVAIIAAVLKVASSQGAMDEITLFAIEIVRR